MKKLGVIFITFILAVVVLGCSSQKDEEDQTSTSNVAQDEQKNVVESDVREDVWNQLDDATKEQIKGTWEEGTVTKTILAEKMGIITDKTFIGKEVYAVDFITKSLAIPNNRIYFASKDNHKIIGRGLVD